MRLLIAVVLLAAGMDTSAPYAATILNRASLSTNLQGLGFSFDCSNQSTTTAASCDSAITSPSITMTGHASAFVDASGLHAWSAVTAAPAFDAPNNFVDANSTAQFGTVMTFMGPLPALAYATMRITTEGIGDHVVGGNLTNLSLANGSASTICSFFNGGSCVATLAFDPTLGLNVGMQLFTQAECFIVLGGCTDVADYRDTSFISSIAFTDGNGTALDLAFALNGLPYNPRLLPEPGTWALIMAGLLGFALLRKRRATA